MSTYPTQPNPFVLIHYKIHINLLKFRTQHKYKLFSFFFFHPSPPNSSKNSTKAFILDLSQMAKPCYLTPILVFFFMSLIVSFPSSSSARPLNKPLNLAANEPLLELELPQENVVVVAYSLDKDSHHVLPCDMERSKPSKLAFPYKAPRFSGKYGPLLLNVLPRGKSTPPSGPSPRIHDHNN